MLREARLKKIGSPEFGYVCVDEWFPKSTRLRSF